MMRMKEFDFLILMTERQLDDIFLNRAIDRAPRVEQANIERMIADLVMEN